MMMLMTMTTGRCNYTCTKHQTNVKNELRLRLAFAIDCVSMIKTKSLSIVLFNKFETSDVLFIHLI